MSWKRLTLGKIVKIIEENREIIKPAYIVYFEVDLCNDGLIILIPTEVDTAEARQVAEEIRRLFGADECKYLSSEGEWSIRFILNRKKQLEGKMEKSR